jgi:hypothetical protein
MNMARGVVLYQSREKVVEVAQATNAGDTASFPNS